MSATMVRMQAYVPVEPGMLVTYRPRFQMEYKGKDARVIKTMPADHSQDSDQDGTPYWLLVRFVEDGAVKAFAAKDFCVHQTTAGGGV